MPTSRTLNSSSLNLVRPELARLIKQAHGACVGWRQQRGDAAGLDACRATLAQISGVLGFVELGDAAELAAELARVLDSDAAQADATLIDAGFLLLGRYLDYLASRRQPAPELLFGQLNALRALRRQPPLAESHFGPHFGDEIRCPGMQLEVAGDAAHELLRKFRQMYQIGLAAVVRGRSDPVNLRLMQRAAERTQRMFGGGEPAEFWWLLDAVLEGLGDGQLRPTPARSRLLSRADREFKTLLAPGGLREIAPLDAALKAELLYLVSKCRRGRRIGEVRSLYSMDAASAPGDQEIDDEKGLLQGPSLDAIDALTRNVRQELQPVKDLLDQIPAGEDVHAVADIPARLGRIVPLLRDAGVHAAAEAIEQQCARIDQALRGTAPVARELLAGVAEALLFVDSTLDELLKSQGVLRTTRDRTPEEASGLMARSILDEARLQMLAGAREAVETVKRAVTGYAEAGDDAALLDGVEQNLLVVKGALAILEHRQAADIAAATAASLAPAIAHAQEPKSRASVAEALADILICLEYYMTALGNDETPDPVMLRLADESLASLRT